MKKLKLTLLTSLIFSFIANSQNTFPSTGSVGIGTTAPKAKLHIPNGDALIGGSTSSNIVTKLNSTLGVISKNNSSSTYTMYVGQSSGTDLFWVKGDGNAYFRGQLGIGTTNPNGYKLAVNGNIRAKEISVETGWSDFVFYADYDLPTLPEVEAHIKEKGHLQDMPSAQEVEENGIYLGEMNSKLLQKIEELMLYTIQQQKEIDGLKADLYSLKRN